MQTNKLVTQKEISWSYPTSPNARTFGFYKTGCYSVAMVNIASEFHLAGFATFAEAKAHADSMPYPYSHYSVTEPIAA